MATSTIMNRELSSQIDHLIFYIHSVSKNMLYAFEIVEKNHVYQVSLSFVVSAYISHTKLKMFINCLGYSNIPTI